MRKFHLYGFSDGRITVITRGETQDQAMSYAARNDGAFKKGVTIYPLDYLPINAAELYDQNHESGWLTRAPKWVQEAEMKEAVKLGLTGVLDQIISGKKSDPVMYNNQFAGQSC